VIIAKVDADGEGKPLGAKYEVTGFPSAFITHTYLVSVAHVIPALKWFDANGVDTPYEGSREFADLVALSVHHLSYQNIRLIAL
jgi:protein disulfide-isomerase A6